VDIKSIQNIISTAQLYDIQYALTDRYKTSQAKFTSLQPKQTSSIKKQTKQYDHPIGLGMCVPLWSARAAVACPPRSAETRPASIAHSSVISFPTTHHKHAEHISGCRKRPFVRRQNKMCIMCSWVPLDCGCCGLRAGRAAPPCSMLPAGTAAAVGPPPAPRPEQHQQQWHAQGPPR
jgi:hypothetical protein